MSVIFQIPTQSRLIPTSTIFSTTFNAITPGRYDFTNDPTNQNVVVIDLQPNTVYFIDRISCGGNVTEGQFLESIESFPFVAFKKLIRSDMVYERPIPVSNFFDGAEMSAFVKSDKGGDQLLFTFSGLFRQLPSMVGLLDLKVQVSLNIFAIESAYFAGAFRDVQANTIGQVNRR